MSMPRALIVSAGFLVAGLLGLGAYFFPVFQAAGSTVSAGSIPGLEPQRESGAPFTVLLLGSDDDAKFPPDRLNTQSMILVRVDPSARQATMLSIPRDLWVPIPNEGPGKISTAYQLGGPEGAVAAVESNFRVHIDEYAPTTTTASRSSLGLPTSTESTRCSTCVRATGISEATSGALNASSRCCWPSRPGPLTSTWPTFPASPKHSTARSRRAWV